MNKPKTPKSSQYLDVYLGALKEPWGAYCAALGKKPGAAIKEAITKDGEIIPHVEIVQGERLGIR